MISFGGTPLPAVVHCGHRESATVNVLVIAPEEWRRIDGRTALTLVHDAQYMLGRPLAGDHGAVTGRLAGAFRGTGRPHADGERHRRSHACGRIHRAWERPVRGSCREFSPSTDVGAEVVGGGFMDVLSPATFRNGNGSVCQMCSTRDSGRNLRPCRSIERRLASSRSEVAEPCVTAWSRKYLGYGNANDGFAGQAGGGGRRGRTARFRCSGSDASRESAP